MRCNQGAGVRGASVEAVPEHGAVDKARSLLELVCDDHIGDSEAFQTSAANATLARVFGDPKHAEAKSAGGDSLDNFLPLLSRISWQRRRHGKKSNATHVGKATRWRRKKQAHLVIWV
jgi:hypothetical protein